FIFQRKLYEQLKGESDNTVELLTDRDDDEYDESQKTPYKHIEYIYISNFEALASAIKNIGCELSNSDIKKIMASQKKFIDDENYKQAWRNIMKKLRVKNKKRGYLESNVLDSIRTNIEFRTDKVQKIFDRFRSNIDIEEG